MSNDKGPRRGSFNPSTLTVVKRARPPTLLPLGTFVRLASGGPIGIVAALDAKDRASVHWLTGHHSVLPDVCLEPCLRPPHMGEE
jgi:hypothetical protein